jgi:hypothetical protein
MTQAKATSRKTGKRRRYCGVIHLRASPDRVSAPRCVAGEQPLVKTGENLECNRVIGPAVGREAR